MVWKTSLPFPGRRALKMAAPFYVTLDTLTVNNKTKMLPLVCTFSSYIKADRDDLPVTMFVNKKHKVIKATTEWRRYSFTTAPELLGWPGGCCGVGWKGPDQGTIWVAAPQYEYARPASTFLADEWSSQPENGYKIDTEVCAWRPEKPSPGERVPRLSRRTTLHRQANDSCGWGLVQDGGGHSAQCIWRSNSTSPKACGSQRTNGRHSLM